jgi:indole-3-glycerol phosphate synthase
MSDVLDKICASKRAEIVEREANTPLSEVKARLSETPPPRNFLDALQAKRQSRRYGLIAEIKKASPSKGVIREDFDPQSLAKAYEAGGAACLSVLTDEPFFQGADAYLIAAKAAVSLPVLRKDFMLAPYQIFESRMIGADCVLLIVAALEDAQAAELEAIAFDLGMSVLIEVHNEAEMERALKLKSPLIGINNRNLKTLEVDIATTEALAEKVSDSKMLVSESGLFTPADLARMSAAGANCFLVGESLMREPDVAAATQTLLTRDQAAVA